MGNKNCMLVDKVEENKVRYEEELLRRKVEERNKALLSSSPISRRRKNVDVKPAGKSKLQLLLQAQAKVPGEKCLHKDIREDIYTRYYELFKMAKEFEIRSKN